MFNPYHTLSASVIDVDSDAVRQNERIHARIEQQKAQAEKKAVDQGRVFEAVQSTDLSLYLLMMQRYN